MLILMNLAHDVDTVLRGELRLSGLHYKGIRSTMDAYVRLYEFHDRRASSGPRLVHLSPELRANPFWNRYRDVIGEVRRTLERGGDVEPYLSKSVQREGNAARDFMQLHWGIRHLHLSPLRTATNGFVQRADHLLFFFLTASDAFLIDIAPHKEAGVFEQERLLAILHRKRLAEAS